MTGTTTHNGDTSEQGSDQSAKICENCGEAIEESEEYFEKRLRTGGRKYRHEDCHNLNVHKLEVVVDTTEDFDKHNDIEKHVRNLLSDDDRVKGVSVVEVRE